MAFVGRDGGVNPTLETLIRLAPLGTPSRIAQGCPGNGNRLHAAGTLNQEYSHRITPLSALQGGEG